MVIRHPPDHVAEQYAADGLVCVGLGFFVDLGVAPYNLRVAMAYADMRSASRRVKTTIHRESEVWCEPWAKVVLYALREQHGGTFTIPVHVVGARLRVVAYHLSAEDRAALAALSVMEFDAAVEYPRLLDALVQFGEPPDPAGKAWRAATALVAAYPELDADD